MPRKPKLKTVQLPVPMDTSQQPITYRTHVDMHLTREQGTALLCLTQALDKEQATVDCGGAGIRRVTTSSGAMRWLLQQLHELAPAKGILAKSSTTTRTELHPPTLPGDYVGPHKPKITTAEDLAAQAAADLVDQTAAATTPPPPDLDDLASQRAAAAGTTTTMCPAEI